jgi:hypothetical protein
MLRRRYPPPSSNPTSPGVEARTRQRPHARPHGAPLGPHGFHESVKEVGPLDTVRPAFPHGVPALIPAGSDWPTVICARCWEPARERDNPGTSAVSGAVSRVADRRRWPVRARAACAAGWRLLNTAYSTPARTPINSPRLALCRARRAERIDDGGCQRRFHHGADAPGERPVAAGWWRRAMRGRIASETAVHAARRGWSPPRGNVVLCGSPGSPPNAVFDRMGRRRTAAYSKLAANGRR